MKNIILLFISLLTCAVGSGQILNVDSLSFEIVNDSTFNYSLWSFPRPDLANVQAYRNQDSTAYVNGVINATLKQFLNVADGMRQIIGGRDQRDLLNDVNAALDTFGITYQQQMRRRFLRENFNGIYRLRDRGGPNFLVEITNKDITEVDNQYNPVPGGRTGTLGRILGPDLAEATIDGLFDNLLFVDLLNGNGDWGELGADQRFTFQFIKDRTPE